MSDDIVYRLKLWATVEGQDSSITDDLNASAYEIEKLRSLISELLPYMLNDMEQGLHLGQPPFEQDHCKDKDILCGDCQWFEDATLWKNRVDAGEFKDYM